MQKTNIHELLTSLQQPVPAAPKAERAVSVTVVYEDAATRQWARETYEQMLAAANWQTVQSTWWKLDGLSEPAVLAGAVSKAMRADVIIVAVRASEGFPLPFYVWVGSWLPHRMQGEGKLVALIAMPTQSRAHRNRAAEYLRAVAQRARMQFEITERNLAWEAPSVPEEPDGKRRPAANSGSNGSPTVLQLFPLRRWRMAA